MAPPPGDGERLARPAPKDATDPDLTDPPFLSDNSHFKTYKTSRYTYPDLRVFYRQHAKARELPTHPGPLPLLVLLHGLGGSVAQFHPLLSSLTDLAPCLALDLPGCGRSKFLVKDWDAYTTEALCELLEVVINDWRDKEKGQKVVLIGHSMGCALAARLASRKTAKTVPTTAATATTTALAGQVIGLVGICPPAQPPDERVTRLTRLFLWAPQWLFMAWRAWDARGGPQSPSVARFVGQNTEPELRWSQYRFNQQSRTWVWRRMVSGLLPTYNDQGKASGGLPGLDVWGGLEIPVFLIGGEDDHLTPPDNITKIMEVLSARPRDREIASSAEAGNTRSSSSDQVTDAAGAKVTLNGSEEAEEADSHYASMVDSQHTRVEDVNNGPHAPTDSPVALPPQPRQPTQLSKSFIFPAPSNHSVLYQPRAVRVVACLVSDFLTSQITERLSLAWQLQYLCREGKWDVKNLTKWNDVLPVSSPIPAPSSPPRHGVKQRPIFRALKTLREADSVHGPDNFVKQWGATVKDVIDISKDQPVYDPHTLTRAKIHYHKFPTVSKIPPAAHEVDDFIALVDAILEQHQERAVKEEWETPEECLIGVHCHYGYNRTGYFVVCYLVERCGFEVKDAIEEFKAAKPNGIRHSHFLDQLSLRYMNWDWEAAQKQRMEAK